MSNPFVLREVKDRYMITWPTFHDIRGNETCYNLLKILFDQIRVYEATLLLNNSNVVSISCEIWYTGAGERYSEWLMSQYDVNGVVFDKRNQAEQLKEELEKRYMWKILKT